MPGFCRDCLADSPHSALRCRGCGSPRLVHHPQLASLAIAHVDCDAFYATIEKRDNPALRDRAVIVGGAKLPAPTPVFPRYVEPPGEAAQ